MDAYQERNRLIALLTTLFPSYLADHRNDGADWDDEWKNVVFVNLPTGQVSWHIHESELPLFEHLRYEENDWDGHTTDMKYDRIADCVDLVKSLVVLSDKPWIHRGVRKN